MAKRKRRKRRAKRRAAPKRKRRVRRRRRTVTVKVSNPRRRRRRRRVTRRRRRRNPIVRRGRRGKFELIPSKAKIMASVQKGAGAVANEMVRASVYTLIGRTSGSVAEDVVGRLLSAGVTGIAAGYLFGQRVADAVVEGSYTVTLYKLVADAVAYATNGAPKIAGVLSNPFTEVPTKPLIPGMGAGAGAPVVGGVSGLGEIVPERDVLPLGTVVPETNIVPIGEMDDEVPVRFRSRF